MFGVAIIARRLPRRSVRLDRAGHAARRAAAHSRRAPRPSARRRADAARSPQRPDAAAGVSGSPDTPRRCGPPRSEPRRRSSERGRATRHRVNPPRWAGRLRLSVGRCRGRPATRKPSYDGPAGARDICASGRRAGEWSAPERDESRTPSARVERSAQQPWAPPAQRLPSDAAMSTRRSPGEIESPCGTFVSEHELVADPDALGSVGRALGARGLGLLCGGPYSPGDRAALGLW